MEGEMVRWRRCVRWRRWWRLVMVGCRREMRDDDGVMMMVGERDLVCVG